MFKAIADGRIPTTGPRGRQRIDPVIADVAWDQNTDPGKPKGPRSKANGSASPAADTQAAEHLMLTRVKRQRQQLEFDRDAGRLIDAADAYARYFELARDARDKLLGLADRLGPAMAPITDARACTLRLREEFQKLAASIAGDELEEGKRAGSSH